jgi:hypothetical protein
VAINPVFRALGMNNGLKIFKMHELCLAGDSLFIALRDGLESNLTLEVLSMSSSVYIGASSISLSKAVPSLRVNRTLKYVHIYLPPTMPMNPGAGTLSLDIVTALQDNSLLESLKIGYGGNTSFGAVECLQANTTLRTLRLRLFADSIVDDGEIEHLISLLKKNNGLET